MRRYLAQKYENRKLRFELWTTGTLAPEAESFLREKSRSEHKYSLAWKTGTDVLEYLYAIGAKRLADVLNEHYLKSPVTELTSPTAPDGDSAIEEAKDTSDGDKIGTLKEAKEILNL